MLSVLVATYNEIANIEAALHGLYKVLVESEIPSEIIVIESNSSDGTREKLIELNRSIPFKILFQQTAEGKGSAIRLGIAEMRGDVFLLFDANQEYSAKDIPDLLEPIVNGRASFVLGTRHEEGRNMRIMENHRLRPFLMNKAHFVFAKILNYVLKTEMTDPFTMYKVLRREVLEGVSFYSNRFDFDWELVIKSVQRGAVPFEVPVQYKSRSFSEGKKVRFFKDPVTWIVALIRFGYLQRTRS